MPKLSYDDFKQMLMDPTVGDDKIAQYLTVDRDNSGTFDPRVIPDESKVEFGEDGRFDTQIALRWANDVSRWRRQRRFESEVQGSRLPVLVSEGDSWFQFPFLFKDVIDQLEDKYLIWSLDAVGDTADNMVNRRPEYFDALKLQKRNGVRAFLFSAAGNDVIGEDESGKSVLAKLVKNYQTGKDAAWHIDQAGLAPVLSRLEVAYRKVITTIRSDPDFAKLPILIHGYDYVIPGGYDKDPRCPWWAAKDRWLGAALRSKGIEDRVLQCDIMRLLIDSLYDMLTGVAGDSATTKVYLVNVRRTLPKVNDWADEIHPTDEGFRRVACHFREALRQAGVGT